jgi:hypothetical protein
VLIGKLAARTMDEAPLVRKPAAKLRTITAHNGTEFHSYQEVERAT